MTQQSTFIPFHKPSIGKEEIKEVEDLLGSDRAAFLRHHPVHRQTFLAKRQNGVVP